jgi:hypothetical protein
LTRPSAASANSGKEETNFCWSFEKRAMEDWSSYREVNSGKWKNEPESLSFDVTNAVFYEMFSGAIISFISFTWLLYYSVGQCHTKK